MSIIITLDERYVVGCVLEGIKVVYENLPPDFFKLYEDRDDLEGELVYKIMFMPEWSEELVSLPIVVVGATFNNSVPIGLGFKQTTVDIGNFFYHGVHRGTYNIGTITVVIAAHALNTLRSLRSKVLYILQSPQFAYFMQYMNIIFNHNYRNAGPEIETVAEPELRYFRTSVNFEFRVEWEVGAQVSVEDARYIQEVASVLEKGFYIEMWGGRNG